MTSNETRSHAAVRLLERLISIRSLSREEGPVADFLLAHLAPYDLDVRRHGDNVLVVLGDGPDRLLLNSHLDVVPPSASHPFDPFTPTFHDGYLWGRGAVDAKASVAAMVTALVEKAEQGWVPESGQVLLALTTCEELGGGYNGLEDVLPGLPALGAALVGEPTDLRPCTAQKGLLILNVVARGRAAHAARASLGENAIARAAADVLKLANMKLDREDPLLGPVSVTPTLIRGGTAKNAVPDECSLTVDVRSTPAYTHPELVEIIRSTVDSEVTVHSDRLIPVRTAPDEAIVRVAVDATGRQPFGSPTMSDWIFLAGTPTVKIGPGSSELSHTADERIRPEERAAWRKMKRLN